MRSLACLLAFAALCLTTVRASESVTPEQALELVDSLTANPVRHDTLSAAVDRDQTAVMGSDAASPRSPRRFRVTFPLFTVGAAASGDVAYVPLPLLQRIC